MTSSMTSRPIAAILLLASAGMAHASSGDAWEGFRQDVSKACIRAAADLIEKGNAVVDPFGSEHYGLAVVSGRPKGVKNAKATVSAICVYDKKTKKAEIGSETPAERLAVRPGK